MYNELIVCKYRPQPGMFVQNLISNTYFESNGGGGAGREFDNKFNQGGLKNILNYPHEVQKEIAINVCPLLFLIRV
jgi:hypothetical protein